MATLAPLLPLPPRARLATFGRLLHESAVFRRFSDAEVEGMYGEARNLFLRGQHERAARIFSLLTLYRPLDPRMREAYGLCCKAVRQHATAAAAFMQAMELSREPRMGLLVAEALLLCGDRPRAEQLLKILQAELKKRGDAQGLARCMSLIELLSNTGAPE